MEDGSFRILTNRPSDALISLKLSDLTDRDQNPAMLCWRAYFGEWMLSGSYELRWGVPMLLTSSCGTIRGREISRLKVVIT